LIRIRPWPGVAHDEQLRHFCNGSDSSFDSLCDPAVPLWDVDVIIRRTLVYGALSASLGLVYLGMVVVLQWLLVALTGESRSEIATVITTLAIAALFTPLRKRIQRDIDRHFYRSKYNAEQALAEFAKTARDETDLVALTGQLVGIVQKTVEPEQVSLWLREQSGTREAARES
jgi:hypothetical protein